MGNSVGAKKNQRTNSTNAHHANEKLCQQKIEWQSWNATSVACVENLCLREIEKARILFRETEMFCKRIWAPLEAARGESKRQETSKGRICDSKRKTSSETLGGRF